MLEKEGQRLRPSFRILRHRFVVIKKFGFLQGFTGGWQKRVCAFNGFLKLLMLQYMDFCVEVEGKKRCVIPYKVSLIILYTV